MASYIFLCTIVSTSVSQIEHCGKYENVTFEFICAFCQNSEVKFSPCVWISDQELVGCVDPLMVNFVHRSTQFASMRRMQVCFMG